MSSREVVAVSKEAVASSSEAPAAAAAIQPKPFLTKLFKMVDEDDTNHIVSWTPAGDALVVHDDEAFAQQLLPLHFKHNNFSSFVRQLNTYGFSKVDPDRWIFAHLHFRRDGREHIHLIQRKSSHRGDKHGLSTAANSSSTAEVKTDFLTALDSSTAGDDGVDDLLDSTQVEGVPPADTEAFLQSELRAIRGHHHSIVSRIRELNSQLQQTKTQQQNTRESIGKIVAFLSQVYHSATNSRSSGGSGGAAVTFDASSILQDPASMHQNKRPRLEQSASELTDLPIHVDPEPVGANGASNSADSVGGLKQLPNLEEVDIFGAAMTLASDDPSAEELPLPTPPLARHQLSLGEEAAKALPDDLQDVALHLVSNPDLQDEVLQQVQTDIIQVGSPSASDTVDLEAFLWDFLEANQDNIESKGSMPSTTEVPTASAAPASS
uniref:HSF-type DNA-binding domain-containing protein n=1 Tax=Calcidiscus leptoporus TaxID=127549 RepID=A0A7S0P3I6_9EUKA